MSWNTAAARRVTTIVRVDGVVRPHEPDGITWAQDITSDLPATITAGGQVAHRTGSIVWRTEGITTRAASPWYTDSTWIPTVGEPVTIDVTDGTNGYRVFTGVIDTVEGDAWGRRSSKVVAELKSGNRVVRRMAQTEAGALAGSGSVGRFGTTPVWVVSEICRELGYSSVPPAPPVSARILDAPLQGSTYNYSLAPNNNAQLLTSHRPDFTAQHPMWASGPDGFGVCNAFLEWGPGTGGGTGAGAIAVSFLLYSMHAGDAAITLTHGFDTITITAKGDGTITVATSVGGVWSTRALAAKAPVSTHGPHRVSLVFRDDTLSTRVAGAAQTLTVPTPPNPVTRIRLNAVFNACIAGLQVWQPSSAGVHLNEGWTPTAHYRYGTGTHSTVLAPSIRDEKARDVLDSYSDALLSPLWIDGYGDLQVVTGKALHDQAPTLTVDALADVSELSYTMALLDHRPTVEVTYAHAHASGVGATSARTQVWQGSGSNVEPDAPDQTFVTVPDDEEWIGLADPATATRVTTDNIAAFQSGSGSWWGMSYDGETLLLASTGGTQLVETLTPWAWKLTTIASEGVQAGSVQTTPDSTLFSPRFREFDLPIYRARALVKYEDRTVAVSTPGATDLDGVLAHDAGRWITTTSAATEIAQWVHGMVGTPTPVLEGLRVRFDPRLDVGVKITVKAQRVFGVDFQALVLSVDHDPGTDTTTVVARVTRVIEYVPTLESVDHAFVGQSLAQWDQARSGRTLTSVAADPLTP